MIRTSLLLVVVAVVILLWAEAGTCQDDPGLRLAPETLFGHRSTPLRAFFSPQSTEVELLGDASTGTLLRHSLREERVVEGGALLQFGIRSVEETEIGMSPIDGTSLSYTSRREGLSRLDLSPLSGRSERTLSLRQNFGAAGVLDFTRSTVSTTDAAQRTREDTVQIMNLAASLGPDLKNATSFTTKKSSDTLGPSGQDWSTRFDATLSGGAAVLALSQSNYTRGGQRTVGRLSEVLLPLKLGDSTLSLAYRDSSTTVDATTVARDDLRSLNLPFKIGDRDAVINYLDVTQVVPNLDLAVRKFDLVLPLSLGSQPLDIQRHIADETKNGVTTESDVTSITLPTEWGRISYTMSDTLKNGTRRDAREFDASTKLRISGHDYTLRRLTVDSEVNGQQVDTVTTSLAGDLPLLRRGTAEYTVVEQTISGVNEETSTLHLSAPIEILGHDVVTDLIETTRETADWERSQRTVKLVAPLLGDALTLQRQMTTTKLAAAPDSEQVITQAITPKIRLFDGLMAIDGRVSETKIDEAEPQRVTGMNVALRPTEGVSLQGSVERRETGPTTKGETRTVTGNYKMSDAVSLDMRMIEVETATQPTTTDRRWILTAKPSGVEVNAGLVEWGLPDGSGGSAPRASIAVGDADDVKVAAEYREFDFDKEGRISPLPKPLVNVALSAGNPEHLAVSLRSIETPGRGGIERGLDFEFPALGGIVRLGYASNTIDPHDPRIVRLGRSYEFALQRKVFADISLDLGLRQFNGDDGEQELFRSIQLAGGDVARGGEIRLVALSGDFVPTATVGQLVADSTFDLSYRRTWGERGLLSVIFRQVRGGPTIVDGEPSTQAIFEYRTTF